MPDFQWTTLITPAGAAATAVFITKGLRQWLQIPSGSQARRFVLVTATLLLLTATLVTSGWDWAALVAAVPTGLTAGFAGIGAYDAATSGLDYRVSSA